MDPIGGRTGTTKHRSMSRYSCRRRRWWQQPVSQSTSSGRRTRPDPASASGCWRSCKDRRAPLAGSRAKRLRTTRRCPSAPLSIVNLHGKRKTMGKRERRARCLLPAEGEVLERAGCRDGAAEVVAGEIPASPEKHKNTTLALPQRTSQLGETKKCSRNTVRGRTALTRSQGWAARTAPWGSVPSGGCGRCACRSKHTVMHSIRRISRLEGYCMNE
jgi:hypothetical protein